MSLICRAQGLPPPLLEWQRPKPTHVACALLASQTSVTCITHLMQSEVSRSAGHRDCLLYQDGRDQNQLMRHVHYLHHKQVFYVHMQQLCTSCSYKYCDLQGTGTACFSIGMAEANIDLYHKQALHAYTAFTNIMRLQMSLICRAQGLPPSLLGWQRLSGSRALASVSSPPIPPASAMPPGLLYSVSCLRMQNRCVYQCMPVIDSQQKQHRPMHMLSSTSGFRVLL